MDNKDEAKFRIEGNPGQNNTFINIGTAYNVNPNVTEVYNTFNICSRKEGEKAIAEATGEKSTGKKLGNMTLREMLKNDLIDTGNLQKEITNYVSCIRTLVKDEKGKLFMRLWACIIEHEAFSVDLYDPGKQQCHFNRNLIANILHYLDGKGFYKKPYNANAFARALEHDADNPVRKALGHDPDDKYITVIDRLLNDLA